MFNFVFSECWEGWTNKGLLESCVTIAWLEQRIIRLWPGRHCIKADANDFENDNSNNFDKFCSSTKLKFVPNFFVLKQFLTYSKFQKPLKISWFNFFLKIETFLWQNPLTNLKLISYCHWKFPFFHASKRLHTKCFLIKLNEAILNPADIKFINFNKGVAKKASFSWSQWLIHVEWHVAQHILFMKKWSPFIAQNVCN